MSLIFFFFFFFFQAEDGIRDWSVTGVQTCALPISPYQRRRGLRQPEQMAVPPSEGASQKNDGPGGQERRSRGEVRCRTTCGGDAIALPMRRRDVLRRGPYFFRCS